MKLLMKCALIASTLSLVLAATPLPADPLPQADLALTPDAPALPEQMPFEGRTIGKL